MPDLAIVDISLGEAPQAGLELVRDMKRIIPGIGILVFSMHEEIVYAERALSAGASGYLMKKEPAIKVLEALEWIARGNIYVSHRVSQTILMNCAGRLRRKTQPEALRSKAENLTPREFEILQALSSGRPPQALAKDLGISVKTLDVHKANMRRKLLLRSSSELNEYSINYFRPPSL
jgi:DNA-binding NarL/FixJ family response regulator